MMNSRPTHPTDLPDPYIPVGVPNLPDTLSKARLTILRSWLEDCDKNHKCIKDQKVPYCPRRLIYVYNDVDSVRSQVVETASWGQYQRERVKYIALSHPWGAQTKSNIHFCSTKENIASHRKHILDKNLPSTFKDAMKVTRRLGVQYLWIDSICILQGPDGDFAAEAEHMQDIFSSAYCVIAASSAQEMASGFLTSGSKVKREERISVELPRSPLPWSGVRDGSSGALRFT